MDSKRLNTVFTGKFADEFGQSFFLLVFFSPTLHFQGEPGCSGLRDF